MGSGATRGRLCRQILSQNGEGAGTAEGGPGDPTTILLATVVGSQMPRSPIQSHFAMRHVGQKLATGRGWIWPTPL